MRIILFAMVCLLFILPIMSVAAESPSLAQEQALSEALDLWRDGRYEQLFEQLSHRGKTSREQFVKKMRDTSIRPACCFQKMENFKILSEKKNTATVYAKIGLEGAPGHDSSSTREFKLVNEGGNWKMQLNDLYSLAEAKGRKKHTSHKKSVHHP